MFGRDKTTAAGMPAPTPVKEGGKGRATPTRREAEARNRRPVVGPPPPPRGATRAERKTQRQARAAASRQERTISRQGALNGDERFLPTRDRGPARRFVRDYVDARFNLGELFLPVAVLSLFIGFVPVARVYGTVTLYLMAAVIVIDSVLLSRRLKVAVAAKFGEKHTTGVGLYGALRALQTRRLRVPKPAVARGEHPN